MGQPVAWCLSNHEKFELLKVFFRKVADNYGQKTPKWFMSYKAIQFYDAFSEINECQPKCLFCTLHVDKTWKKELRKKICSPQVQAETYHMPRAVLEQTDMCLLRLKTHLMHWYNSWRT